MSDGSTNWGHVDLDVSQRPSLHLWINHHFYIINVPFILPARMDRLPLAEAGLSFISFREILADISVTYAVPACVIRYVSNNHGVVHDRVVVSSITSQSPFTHL